MTRLNSLTGGHTTKNTFRLFDPDDEDDMEVREVDGYTVERKGEYGFWFVRKPDDARLEGAFTDIEKVKAVIKSVKTSKAIDKVVDKIIDRVVDKAKK
jgi:hypothetical protein